MASVNSKSGKPEPKSDSMPEAKDDLKSLPTPEVEKRLSSSQDGLSQAEAEKRLTQYGPNEITEKITNPFLKFLTYFWGPIPWMIELAVILSGVVRHWPDFFIILLLLVSNAMVGFWEERQAVYFQPFDPVHKRTGATVEGGDGMQSFVAKGAPQVTLEISTNAGEVKPAVKKAVKEFAGRGFRSLGAARAEQEGKWRFVGVSVKMVTGDQAAIARETVRQLGMGTNILDASGLGDTKRHETVESAEAIEKADGFAQVFPKHKFHVVDVLHQRGHIVGMTGDGVNDAPALKKADCGIAVSGATDAARAAAAIVLSAYGLSVIVDATKESRKIFQRMNSYAIYRIAETLRGLFFMTLAILIYNFYPLTAVMIVMLALLNDGAILSVAYHNVHYKVKPETWNMRLVLGVIGVVSALGLFYLGERVFHVHRAHIQTLMYLKVAAAGHLTIFLTRTRSPFSSIRPTGSLWAAMLGTQALATLIAACGLFMMPLGRGWAAFVWGNALAWFMLNDRVKLLAYRIFDPTKPPLLDKKLVDLTPRIAARAYELHQQRVRGESQADQDWLEAEHEIRKREAR